MSAQKKTTTKHKTAKKATANTASKPDYAKAEINQKLSNEDKLGLYKEMVRIRRFEERTLRAYQQGKIGGFLHLYIGQEAVAVGTCSLRGQHDHYITAYRDHGHALALGMSMNECMAELQGKATGCSKGKGGSMHFFAPDKNFWGGHGIVGGQTPLGLGLAYAVKYKGETGCCLCFMGDGAINQGAVHESFNMASLWDLPVIYVIENNGYSMGTSLERSSAHPGQLARRAEGYDMDWDYVEGNDLYQVRAKTWEAMQRAHEKSRPTLLEIATYRYRGHSVADANHEKYRTKEEIEDYKKNKDPISRFQKTLLGEGVLNDDLIKEIDLAAKQEADESDRFANASPYPEFSAITEDVYWSEDNQKLNGEEGRIFFELPTK